MKSKILKLTVKDIFEIGRGRVISQVEIRKSAGKYPVYSSQTSNKGEMGKINSYDFEGEYLTWTTDGAYAGAVFYRNGKFNCTNVCGTLKNNNKYEIDLLFVSYLLPLLTEKHVVRGGNPKLMNGIMGDIEIAIPESLAEQKRIAKILTCVDNNIDITEQEIKKLEYLQQGLIFSFKGSRIKLSDIVSIRGGRLETKSEVKNGKYPFFICAEDPVRINNADYDQEAVLVAGTGKVYIFYYNGKFNARQKVHILSKRTDVTINYDLKLLYYIMKYNVEYFRGKQAGMGLKNVDQEGVMGFDFIMPENSSLALQLLETNFKKIDILKEKKQKLEQLKKGLLNDLL